MRISWSVSESRIRRFSKTGFYVYKCTFHILVKSCYCYRYFIFYCFVFLVAGVPLAVGIVCTSVACTLYSALVSLKTLSFYL